MIKIVIQIDSIFHFTLVYIYKISPHKQLSGTLAEVQQTNLNIIAQSYLGQGE